MGGGMDRELTKTQKQFVYNKRVFLKDTNAEGNVYFARFFEWQGEAREEFFRQNVPDHLQILQSGTRLITVNAWMTYKRSAFLFDEILVDIKTTHLKNMSLELFFTFINKATDEVIAHGGEKLAFSDPAGTAIPIPPSVRENATYFLNESSPELAELHETMRRSKIA